MPKSLEKTRKKIAKKKGNITALHENSRDSQRLQRAKLRDDKLTRIAASRKKQDQPLIERIVHCQHAVRRNDSRPLELQAVQSLIQTLIHQYDDEMSELKSERRPGRPASTREDLLRKKIATAEREYTVGFYLPDLMDADNVTLLDRWQGAWSYLSTLKWIRITQGGRVQPSHFPPKGQS